MIQFELDEMGVFPRQSTALSLGALDEADVYEFVYTWWLLIFSRFVWMLWSSICSCLISLVGPLLLFTLPGLLVVVVVVAKSHLATSWLGLIGWLANIGCVSSIKRPIISLHVNGKNIRITRTVSSPSSSDSYKTRLGGYTFQIASFYKNPDLSSAYRP